MRDVRKIVCRYKDQRSLVDFHRAAVDFFCIRACAACWVREDMEDGAGRYTRARMLEWHCLAKGNLQGGGEVEECFVGRRDVVRFVLSL